MSGLTTVRSGLADAFAARRVLDAAIDDVRDRTAHRPDEEPTPELEAALLAVVDARADVPWWLGGTR